MKPRTKLQHDIVYWAKYLPQLTKKQSDWAQDKCLLHLAFATTHQVYCMDCGEKMKSNLIVGDSIKCTGCKQQLTVRHTRNRTFDQFAYFAIVDLINEYEIVRYFKVSSGHKAGWKKVEHCMEVCQHWYHENGKMEVFSRLNYSTYYNCHESWSGDFEIRNKNNLRKYEILQEAFHPSSKFKDEYTFYGINSDLRGLTYQDAKRIIPYNSKAETLAKCGQYQLLNVMLSNQWEIHHCWPSIKIAIRNNYIVEDARTWLDYLTLLHSFGKDLRSPKYLFPSNLKEAHDKLVEKRRELQRKEDEKKQFEKMIENEKIYKETHSQFFHLNWSYRNFTFTVLQSIFDFKMEGDQLKHCVYTNNYFLKENSLCISIKRENEHYATCEIDIKGLKVLQLYGKRNSVVEQNDELLTYVKSKVLPVIEKISHSQKKTA